MKVILFNGSPKEKGCTYTALTKAAEALNSESIETEIFHAGKATKGCLGCGACSKTGKCITDDCVNEAIAKLSEADGFVLGSPVHYAGASGEMTSFLDRLFYAGGKQLCYKPCGVVASCRRGGSTATLDQLLKYPEIMQMPIVSSMYWTMVHGNTPEEVLRDEEGMQVMRVLGKNMAWMLKCIEAGKKAGIVHPEPENKIKTNFIR